MEILLPPDMSKQVTLIKQLSENYSTTFRKTVEELLPEGYTFIVNDSSYTRVIRTPKNREDLKWSYLMCELILYKNSNSVSIEDKATPEDVYKLSGIIQLLVGVTSLGVSEIQIVK